MIHGVAKPRLHWDGAWYLDAPHALSPAQIARVAAWALPHQRARLSALPLGDRRDECARSIRALEAGHITVRASGDVFQSTQRTRPDRAIIVL